MPYLRTFDGLFTTDRGRRVVALAAVSLALFVAIDALVIHPFVWGNQPTLFYFAVKPVFVGIGLLGATWYIMRRTTAGDATAIFTGALVGVVYLQLYYTVAPIPLVGGEAVQVGLIGNLAEGVPVHFGALAIAVLIALWVIRR